DGRVDYAAALDARYGAGITPDNNAAPLLARAGVLTLDAATRLRLGLPLTDDGGPTLETSTDYVQRLASAGDTAARDTLLKQRGEALRHAWREAEAPLAADWLRRNE